MPVDIARVEEIFVEAVGITDRDARAAYVDRACGNDSELRQRVNALLAAHHDTSNFLKLPATDGGTSPFVPLVEGPSSRIGRYKLLEQIGEGGFGVVYRAEQLEPVHRMVALKIIKLGMDTRQVVARFEAERQALAIMDHPNIARVIDAGTTETGRPYFVMELVNGVPITEYCDRRHLSVRQRLELMTAVCQAVQHAHQKGIIHRDIKPNNILVAEYDDRPVPKVIDFGVAKATAHKLTERTVFTEFGQVVGTFEYMSPEQAKLNKLDIDTRSDIYSLGAVMYELLTGSTPFERKQLNQAAFDEALRIIREVEPPRPSTKVSASGVLPAIAASRDIEPQKLAKLFRGELDWIVMKTLEKDRDRRYETASGLAADIERYLRDEPVLACSPSPAYRLRKFAGRNKGAMFIAALVAFFLIVLAGGVIWEMRARIERLTRFRIELALSRADFASTLQWIGRFKESEQQLRQAETLLRKVTNREEYLLLSHVQNDLGVALFMRGNLTAAETALRESLAIRIADAETGEQSSVVAWTLRHLATVLQEQGKFEDAEAKARQSLDMFQRFYPDATWSHADLSNLLGSILTQKEEFSQAEPLLLDAYESLPRWPIYYFEVNGRVRSPLENLIRLYDAWEKTEPGKGYGEKAAHWRSMPQKPTWIPEPMIESATN